MSKDWNEKDCTIFTAAIAFSQNYTFPPTFYYKKLQTEKSKV